MLLTPVLARAALEPAAVIVTVVSTDTPFAAVTTTRCTPASMFFGTVKVVAKAPSEFVTTVPSTTGVEYRVTVSEVFAAKPDPASGRVPPAATVRSASVTVTVGATTGGAVVGAGAGVVGTGAGVVGGVVGSVVGSVVGGVVGSVVGPGVGVGAGVVGSGLGSGVGAGLVGSGVGSGSGVSSSVPKISLAVPRFIKTVSPVASLRPSLSVTA